MIILVLWNYNYKNRDIQKEEKKILKKEKTIEYY